MTAIVDLNYFIKKLKRDSRVLLKASCKGVEN